MAAAIIDVYRALDQWAPFDTQMDFDNAGFLVGRGGREVGKILVALDITEEVAEEAERWGTQLIVAHHPVIFHPARQITDGTPTGRILLRLIEGGVAAICAHTNLDAAEGGVNDQLAWALGLTDTIPLNEQKIGRIGTLSCEKPLEQFLHDVVESLGCRGLRYRSGGRPVHRVAVGGGACGEYIPQALAQGCDTFVTADVKYDQFLEAKALGITLMDAGHYATEQVVCPKIVEYLARCFPALEVRMSRTHREVYGWV